MNLQYFNLCQSLCDAYVFSYIFYILNEKYAITLPYKRIFWKI